MSIPIDLLCGDIASYLDRKSINSLQLASKDIHDILKRTACFPWPDSVRFFNQAYSKCIMFAPNGKWLVYADMNGIITIWERHKGKFADEQSSLDWISLLTISASSTWLACANTIDDKVAIYHLPTATWHESVKCQSNMNSMVFVHDILCVTTKTGIGILDVNNATPSSGDEVLGDCGASPSAFRLLHEGTFKFMTPVHWVEPILAAADMDHQVHLWVLDKNRTDGHRILCHADSIDATHRYVVSMSAIGDGGVPNGNLAVAGWCYATKTSFIDLWSCTESALIRRIPIDHKIHVSSLVMVSKTSWVIADGAIDQVRVWRNFRHYARCQANPTRMAFTLYKSTIAWIGRGSTLWLRDLDTLVD
ncbi:unnamed protein product [Cylindrotheca closterium]|uniref:F-box domain-containing protein n=1 Tax=Cylindrotheca closterium TaxID=2856 RepID=A0AAD2FPQ8_9STRA|nr:unnamed protein product [Cylindrotheca closterium]